MTGFRPDGTLTIGTFNGHAYRWDPSRQAALDYACRVAGRDSPGRSGRTPSATGPTGSLPR